MKIFVSYTSSDRPWAQWIGWQLRDAGHQPFIHDWEISAGQNIAGWMEESFKQADCLIGIFSDAYCDAKYSQSERWAAYWKDPRGSTGFLVPIEVQTVSNWPELVSPLKRLSLVGLEERDASAELIAFLQPAHSPTAKPPFPGLRPPSRSFTDGSEPLDPGPPIFPATAPRTKVAQLATNILSPVGDSTPNIRCINDHEPQPEIFGREGEIETIVRALLGSKTILVAGGPGMGKTAVATAALYDPRIVGHFGRHRIFASLETATEPRAILAKLVESLGLPPTGDEATLLRILQVNVTEQPLAAILDNAETVFDADRSGSDRLLNLVAQIQGMSLLVTIRGVPPHVPGAVIIDDLSKLDPSAAREAFLAVAGDLFRDDSDLSHLLEALDGHALSIRLVAAQAIGSSSLRRLRESWDEAHAKILRASGVEESRLTSVRASLALSLNSRRMKDTPLARRLIALLAFLPAGLDESVACSLLGERGFVTKAKANDAIICLNQLRLVERRLDRRLRTLTPLRESVKDTVAPLQADRDRLLERYLRIAEKGEHFGKRYWAKYREEIEAEVDNLDSVCDLAVRTNLNRKGLGAALSGLKILYLLSGQGGVTSITSALDRVRNHPPSRLKAFCIRALGDIALERRDFETARLHYDDAILLYRRIDAPVAEADCIFRLGEIAIIQSDHQTATLKTEKSLALGKKLGSKMIVASSTALLGAIAIEQLELDLATTLYFEALTLFRATEDSLGEANCLRRLGNIARKQSDNVLAETRLVEAKMIYHRIGHSFGEANCIFEFGDIASAQGNYERALTFYEDSLSIYRRTGDIGGEAQATIRLGQMQMILADPRQGRSSIDIGFALYFKNTEIGDRALPGWKALHLALVCEDPADSQKYREVARSSWTDIGRLDLIVDWIESI